MAAYKLTTAEENELIRHSSDLLGMDLQSREYKDARMRYGRFLHELPHGGIKACAERLGRSYTSVHRIACFYRDMRDKGFGRHLWN